MSTGAPPRRPLRRAAGAAATVLPRLVTRVRRDPPPERLALLLLIAAALGITAAGHVLGPLVAPGSMLVLPVIGAALLLERRAARVLFAVVALCFAYQAVDMGVGVDGVRPGVLLVLLVTAGVSYEFARTREETGLSGSSGEGVLVELRERLQTQGDLPPLPPPWRAEVVVRPAGGVPFAGDFAASALTGGGRRLEIALVDVSGKGVAAGTRALLLSGAVGGLLGAVPPAQFLPAANTYLLRQGWDEGFATAVHLVLHLDDGAFAVRSAGHPPAALYDAGSGRWSLTDAAGPALGLLPDVEYEVEEGRLEPGDAILLYTDGLVEVPGRALETGIDRLLGQAERLVTSRTPQPAASLVGPTPQAVDDQGLVLVRNG